MTTTKEVFILRDPKGANHRTVEEPHMLIGERGNLICIGTYEEVNECFAEKVHKLRELGLANGIDDLNFVKAPRDQKEIDKIMTSPLYASRYREQSNKHLYWQ